MSPLPFILLCFDSVLAIALIAVAAWFAIRTGYWLGALVPLAFGLLEAFLAYRVLRSIRDRTRSA
jgi:hypothetical protein